MPSLSGEVLLTVHSDSYRQNIHLGGLYEFLLLHETKTGDQIDEQHCYCRAREFHPAPSPPPQEYLINPRPTGNTTLSSLSKNVRTSVR